MPTRLRDLIGGVAAMALGLAAYFVVFGVWPLIPTNIAFLDHGDRAMHTLGWMFFRDVPWGTPPGASPNLGIELSNSIALVDGLPLFAIPLKLISAWLPRPFQYWGYWWLACFTLQALFSYLLARALGARYLIAILAAGFAVITPAFLFRLTLHMALAGHFLIIAGLWLYARRAAPPVWAWPLLVAVTAAVHAYLLAMVLVLWVAAWLERLWSRRFIRWNVVLEPLLLALATFAVLWAVGFLYTGSVGSYGFGFYRLNVLWPFISYRDWSQVVPDLPHAGYDYEGLSFLGIGVLVLLALSIVSGAVLQLRVLFTRRYLPLLAAVAIMAICALSDHVGLLDLRPLVIPMPGPLEFLGGVFRSSGRFVWPLLYLVTVGAAVLVARRLSPGWSLVLVTLAFAVQVVDSSKGWMMFRQTQPAPADHWENRLSSPFWERAAAAGYSRLRAIPVLYHSPSWRDLEYSAYLNHQQVDAIYLGRVDDKALEALQATEEQALATGAFEPRTLYFIDFPTALRIAPFLQPDDLLALIDRHIVFARGAAPLVDGLGIQPQGMGPGG